jgi:hypothetical protein
MKPTIFSFALLLSFSITSCQKGTNKPTGPLDSRFYGTWQVDSITDKDGTNSRNQFMDTAYSLSYYASKTMIMTFFNNDSVSCTSYRYDIIGSFRLLSATALHFNLTELVDFAGIISDWQPMVVAAFNAADSYQIAGDGSSGSQLYVYYNQGNQVIRCTKQ